MFKVELHTHSKFASCDAKMNVKDLVLSMKEKGIDGFVLSNHYNFMQVAKYLVNKYKEVNCSNYEYCYDCPYLNTVNNISKTDYKKLYNIWLEDIREAIKIGKEYNIHAYAGMEYTLYDGTHIEILGCTVEEFENNVIEPDKSIDELINYVRKFNGIVIQNHPKRSNTFIKEVDGYECLNSKYSIIDMMGEEEFKDIYNVKDTILVCGGDIHSSREIGKSFVGFEYEPRDEKELVNMLKDRKYNNYIAESFSDLSFGYEDIKSIRFHS